MHHKDFCMNIFFAFDFATFTLERFGIMIYRSLQLFVKNLGSVEETNLMYLCMFLLLPKKRVDWGYLGVP